MLLDMDGLGVGVYGECAGAFRRTKRRADLKGVGVAQRRRCDGFAACCIPTVKSNKD